MNLEQAEFTLKFSGVAPLLMRSGQLADPLNEHSRALHRITSKRLKTTEDHKRIAHIEWRGGLWLSGGRPCIPAEAVEAVMVAGAKHRRLGATLRSALFVRETSALAYVGPDDLDELYADAAFVHRCGVRVGNRTTMRTRPRFERWSIETTISYLPSAIDYATLLEIARFAGSMVGLGDFRPRFGRFSVDVVG